MTTPTAPGPHPPGQTIVVTGATGYVGGRLVPRLLAAGYRVRCLVREPRKLDARPWRHEPAVEVLAVDLENVAAVTAALQGATAGYWLVHSMIAAAADYRRHDLELAHTFATAAKAAGLQRIVYLGGLGETGAGLSEHLDVAARGRARTGRRSGAGHRVPRGDDPRCRLGVVRDPALPGRTPAGDDHAALGAHAASRSRRLNVLGYLVACLAGTGDQSAKRSTSAGREVMTYRRDDPVHGRGARTATPLDRAGAGADAAAQFAVDPPGDADPRQYRAAARRGPAQRSGVPRRPRAHPDAGSGTTMRSRSAALEAATAGDAGRNALVGRRRGCQAIPTGPAARCSSTARNQIAARQRRCSRPRCALGGGHGWYAADWLWRLRGILDKLVGGPGLRRGRRDPVHLARSAMRSTSGA
jgi:NAD(P)-dependent dehydrogenase (short-subunit alcohol dehydrogenase family)